MKFNNLNIGVRLGASYALLLVMMVLLTVSGLLGMQQIQGNLERVTGEFDRKEYLLYTMSESVHVVARVSRSVVLLEHRGHQPGHPGDADHHFFHGLAGLV